MSAPPRTDRCRRPRFQINAVVAGFAEQTIASDTAGEDGLAVATEDHAFLAATRAVVVAGAAVRVSESRRGATAAAA